MTEQDCTSGICTTKAKETSFTHAQWVWGIYDFYYQIMLLNSFTSLPFGAAFIATPIHFGGR